MQKKKKRERNTEYFVFLRGTVQTRVELLKNEREGNLQGCTYTSHVWPAG